jgi:hypothetical protein
VFLIECRPTFQRCVLPPSSGLITLMMEAARTAETSVDLHLRTQQYIPEDSELHTRRRKNLKSHNSLPASQHSLRVSVKYSVVKWERRIPNLGHSSVDTINSVTIDSQSTNVLNKSSCIWIECKRDKENNIGTRNTAVETSVHVTYSLFRGQINW